MKQDPIIKKPLEHDKMFERIEKKFWQVDDRFDGMEVKIQENHNQVLNRLDKIMTTVQRLDQERLFTFEIVKRMQKQIDQHGKELVRVKQLLHIK